MLLRATLGAGLAIGCAQIFGIEEACELGKDGCGDAASSAGASGSAGSCTPGQPGCTLDPRVEAECSDYCAQMRDKCASPPQYAEDEERATECESLCRQFPSAGGESRVGNTRECRLDRISSSTGSEEDCLVAGRGGQGDVGGAGACGTKCESYCSLMRTVCPAHFARFAEGDGIGQDLAACEADCARLSDRGEFDATLQGVDEFDEEDGATVQCRLWHLGYAAVLADQNGAFDNAHCEHAVGLSQCNPTPPL